MKKDSLNAKDKAELEEILSWAAIAVALVMLLR